MDNSSHQKSMLLEEIKAYEEFANKVLNSPAFKTNIESLFNVVLDRYKIKNNLLSVEEDIVSENFRHNFYTYINKNGLSEYKDYYVAAMVRSLVSIFNKLLDVEGITKEMMRSIGCESHNKKGH